jgi:cellulose synthase/poly-beta-1,6-N-acetylglucosamine synthase-like glycosyltransferase
MSLTMEIVFWAALGSVVYSYVGYPVLLFVLAGIAQAKSDLAYLLRRRNRRRTARPQLQPGVALLLSAYNEEVVIESKVKNCLELEYPEDRLEILIGLDAPSDATPEILNRLHSLRISVFHFSSRRGKLAVLADLAQRTSNEILVFSDANTMLERDCLQNLVRHFVDPQVGAVSGEEVRVPLDRDRRSAESVYWTYESALKVLESRLNCTLVVNGSVHAVRRSLFNPRMHLMAEDLHVPMDIRYAGYRVIYDPEAIAVEDLAPTTTAHFERRARVAAHSFQTFFGVPSYLNPLKGLPAFAYFSHKVLRWFAPLLLMIAFLANLWLVTRPAFAFLLAAQCLFYGMAVVGYVRKRHGKPAGIFQAAYYFIATNLLQLTGLFRYLRGHQLETWKVTPRNDGPNLISATSGRDD